MKVLFQFLILTTLNGLTAFSIYASDSVTTPVLDPGFKFKCSEISDCNGVYPIRSAEDSEAALLINGEKSFALRIQSLMNAKKSIRIQNLIYTADESGKFIAEILKQKKAQGLDVRMIVDTTANEQPETQYLYTQLKEAGIPVIGGGLRVRSLLDEFNLKNPGQFTLRYHEKFWIIDAEEEGGIAIVGGMNVQNTYFRLENDPVMIWRDQDLAVRGRNIVGDAARGFDHNYDAVLLSTHSGPPDHQKKVIKEDRAEILEKIKKAQVTALDLDWHKANMRLVESWPRYRETFIHQSYIQLIREAKSQILIANAYLIPSDEMISELRAAALRGVDVRIISNDSESCDSPLLTMVARYHYDKILKPVKEGDRLPKLYEWNGKRAGQGLMHSKFMVVDQRYLLIGSANLENRSRIYDAENVIVVDSEPMAKNLADFYLTSDLNTSTEITYEFSKRYKHYKNFKNQFMLWLGLRMERML